MEGLNPLNTLICIMPNFAHRKNRPSQSTNLAFLSLKVSHRLYLLGSGGRARLASEKQVKGEYRTSTSLAQGRGLMRMTTLLDTRVAQRSDVAQQLKECVVACRHPNSYVLLFVDCLGGIHPSLLPPPISLLHHRLFFGRNTRSELPVWNPLLRKHKR